ncbi:MAG: MerR family transcriptional regulator [Caldilineaceae bacterium]|nr:MerR family transcriptional regulator [Caldilineaceae bacterium]
MMQQQTHHAINHAINHAIIRRRDAEALFAPEIAAALAGISRQALEQYRRAGLVQLRRLPGGLCGYGTLEIQQLRCIRRLREEVALDLAAVEVVLHLREQVFQLQQELNQLRQQATQREATLREAIRQLHQEQAIDSSWR